MNDCYTQLEGTQAHFLSPLSVHITFSSVRHWNRSHPPVSVGTTGTSAASFIRYIELHLASVVCRFNLVVSRFLICSAFTNGSGRPLQAAPRRRRGYLRTAISLQRRVINR